MTEFVDRLKEADASVKGSTAVFDYTNGKKTPPINFLQDAADLLGVTTGWLLLGGPMTWGETASDEDRDALSQGLWSARETDYIAQRLAPGDTVAATAFWKVLRLLVQAKSTAAEKPSDDDVRQLAKDVLAAVGEAIEVVSLCKPEGSRFVLSYEDSGNLSASVLHAIGVAIQARMAYRDYTGEANK